MHKINLKKNMVGSKRKQWLLSGIIQKQITNKKQTIGCALQEAVVDLLIFDRGMKLQDTHHSTAIYAS